MDPQEILKIWDEFYDLRLKFNIETNELCTMAIESKIPKNWTRKQIEDAMIAVGLRKEELPRSNDPASRYCEMRRAYQIFCDRYYKYYEYQAKELENVNI